VILEKKTKVFWHQSEISFSQVEHVKVDCNTYFVALDNSEFDIFLLLGKKSIVLSLL